MSEISQVLGDNADTVFRALVECVPDFVCLATTHGELFYFNAAARRWIGLDEEPRSPRSACTTSTPMNRGKSFATWPCRP